MDSNIDANQVISSLQHAFNLLYKNDLHLIKIRSSEISIAHKLACYLTPVFSPEFDVDIEYDRDFYYQKTNQKGRKVYQDILIHKRNCDKYNLIHFEIKKNLLSHKDIVKVHDSIKDRNYRFGIVIYRINAREVLFIIYEKGVPERRYRYSNNKVIVQSD